jgi:hypothetical protein
MGTYVVGGLVLFGIGFITYEIIEGMKEIKAGLTNAANAVQNTPTPFQTANTYTQSASVPEQVGIFAVQPLALTLAELAYNEFEGI